MKPVILCFMIAITATSANDRDKLVTIKGVSGFHRRPILQELKKLKVAIQVDVAKEKSALERKLRTQAELKLRKLGILVVEAEEVDVVEAPVVPILAISVDSAPVKIAGEVVGHVGSYGVYLIEEAVLVRNRALKPIVSKHYNGFYCVPLSKSIIPTIEAGIDQFLDEFLNEFLKANPVN